MTACILMVVLLTTSVVADKIQPMPIASPEDFKRQIQLRGNRSFTAYSGAILERLVPGKYGWTELMEAAANADIEAVKSLLAKGLDVNAKDDAGGTALMVAASGGHIEIVRLLLEAGADVNVRDKYSRTALSEARHDNDVAVIHILLDNGADPNTKLIGEISFLEFASQEGRKEIVQALLDKGADLKMYGGRALVSAARRGHSTIVQALLSKGVDASAQDKEGYTALVVAASGDHADTVKILLRGDADVNAKDSQGRTAIEAAVTGGHSAIVSALLAAGATVNTTDISGRTILSLAAERGDEDIVKILLESGADVKLRDSQGTTALEYADVAGHTAIVKALLSKETIGPKAVSLVYIQEDKSKCNLKIWNRAAQSSILLHHLKDCPKNLYVDNDRNTIFIIKGDVIQEIVFRPQVIIKSPLKLPFKEGTVRVNGEERWNTFYQAGYLKDGRLAVINQRFRPADDSDMFLYVWDKSKWILIRERFCARFDDCTLDTISGHSWRAWRRESHIWHPILSLNPFVIDRGIARNEINHKAKRRGKGQMRYIKLSIDGHESILYHNSKEGEHSFGLYTFSIYLKTHKDKAPVELSDVQCSTAVEDKYLLLDRYFGEGMDLIDLETGKRLLKGLKLAFWIY